MAKRSGKAKKRHKPSASKLSKLKKKKNISSRKPMKAIKAKAKKREAHTRMAKKKSALKKAAKKSVKSIIKKKSKKASLKALSEEAPVREREMRTPAVSRAVRESLEAIKSDLSENTDVKIHKEVEIRKPPMVLDKVYLQSMSFEMASMRQALDRIGRQLDKLEKELTAHRNGEED